MKRSKTVGIAIGMVLALTAFVGATSASANFFKAGVEPETWSGSLAGKNHTLLFADNFGNSEQIACSGVAFSGETTIKTLSDVTVTPQLGGCNYLGFSVGWTINGCKYRFHPGAGPALAGTMDIVGCEKPMQFQVSTCVMEIGNQSGLSGVEYKNVGAGTSVTVIAKLTGIKYTRSGCPNGFSGTFYKGSYTGEWTVKGTTSGGAASTVSVESTSAAPFTKFAAEEAPVTIASTDNRAENVKRITAGLPGVLYCESFALNGSSASATPEAVTLTPAYKKCKIGSAGEIVPEGYVSSGGCSYVFHANGTFDIAGGTCASNPMTITAPGCIATIGPQSGLSVAGSSYANVGSGKLRTVSLLNQGRIEGVTYSDTGVKCANQGTFTNGVIYVTANFTATNSKGEPQGFSIE